MPVIVHTRVGTIREVVGTAFRLGPDGSEQPLKAGDRVLAGDAIVTRQDSFVEIVEDAVQPALVAGSAEANRVIAAIEAGDPAAAPGAGLAGGAGSSLSDGFRVGRISEDLGASAPLPALEPLPPSARVDSDTATDPEPITATEPLPTITVDAPAPGSDTTPLIVGSASQVAGRTVTLTVTDANGATQTFFAVVLADGSYSAEVPLPLADGPYTVVAEVSTAGGVSASASDDGLIDSSAPIPTISLDPVAGNDVLNVAEAGEPAITLSGRVGGDARPGDTVTVSVGGQDFLTTVQADGSFAVRVPGSLLASGAAAGVTAVVNSIDDAGNSASASAARPYSLNAAPLAVDDDVAQPEDGPAARGDLTPGTAGQDRDPEGDSFSVTAVAAAGSVPVSGTGVGSAVAGRWGSLVVAADGSYVYTPGSAAQSLGANDTATDVFTYQVTDSEGNTATATLTVSLTGTNDAALITGTLAGQVVEDGQLIATGRVLVNDADSGESALQPLTDLAGRYGSFSIGSDGAWTYRLGNPSPEVQALAAGQTVTERFTVTSSDGSTSVVVVSVLGTDDAAVVSAGTGSVVEDSRPTATGTLIASDIDNPAPGFVAAVQAGTWGALTLLASGAWSYTLGDAAQALAAGEVVNERFAVSLSDGSTTTVTITVAGTDDAPVITDGIGAVIEDTRPAASGTLSASDIDNPALAFVAVVQPGAYGELSLQANGQWTYALGDTAQALAEGEVVTEPFTVLLNDGSSTTVTITVRGTDDAPLISLGSGSVVEDDQPTATGTLTASDIDNPALAFVPGTQAGLFGTLTLTAGGAWSYTLGAAAQALAAGATAADPFTVTLDDGTTTTVFIDITGTDDRPLISAGTGVVVEDDQPTATGTLTASDIDNPALAFVAASENGAYGTLTLSAGGAWSYTLGAAAQALAAGQRAAESFTVTLTDGSTTTVTIAITGTDDLPLISAGTGSVIEDSQPTATGTLKATDVDNPGLGFVAGTSAGSFGELTLTAAGGWSYTLAVAAQALAAGEVAVERFTVTLNDGSTTTVTINITGTDDRPIISAGRGSVVEDDQPSVTGSLTATDVDNPLLAFVAGDQVGTWGTLTLQTSGAWSYTLGMAAQALAAGQQVGELFTVLLDDGSRTTVTIAITGTDDLPLISTDVGSVVEDDQPTVTGTLLASDIDNPVLAFVGGAQAGAYGELTLQTDGAWSYTLGVAAQALAAGQQVSDLFTVTLSDGSTTTVTIRITGTNDQPSAVADGFATDEDTLLTGLLGSNDTASGDGGNVWALATQAANGTVVVNADGSFSYTPAADFNGSDSFTYTLTDADGDVSTATVELTVNPVNDQPVAVADRFTTDEDTLLTGLLGSNDTASGDGGNVWALATQAANGTVVVNADGSFSYTPAADFNGSDSFTYTLTDADGDVSTATVELTVNPVNDQPLAVADTATAREAGGVDDGTPGLDPDGNVLTNDIDIDAGDTRSVSAVAGAVAGTVGGATAGLFGTLTLAADGQFIYTVNNALAAVQTLRDAEDTLTDTFSYTTTDAGGLSSTTTLTVTITGANDAPTPLADTAAAREAGGVANGTPGLNPVGNLLDNDTDIDAGDTRVVSAVAGTAAGIVGGTTDGLFGSLTLAVDGQYEYAVNNTLAAVQALRDAGDTLTDTFSYTVTDANGLSSISTLTVTINGANDAPIAVNDGPLSTDEDTPLAGIVVLGNDTDVEGDLLTVTAASSAQGRVTVNADQTLGFTPNTNFNGPASISYTISDGRGGSATATVTINVRPVVDLTATDDSFTVIEDSFVNGSVAGNDSTTSGGVLTYAVARNPASGGVIFNADGSFRYTPRGNFNGPDSFEYIVTDAASGEALRRTVSLGVTLVNDAPVVTGGAIATLTAINEDTANPPGATVSSLFSANFSNTADAGNLTQNRFAGVAIVGDASSALAGRWQYSTNAGTNWLDLGAVSDAAARVLLTTDRLRFLPAADFNGNVPALSVRLLDNSLPFTSGALADVTLRGGITPVSSGTVALTTRINAVNDAPVAPSAEITATEEGADVGPAITAPFDIDSPTITIRVTALPTIGEFYLKVGNVLTLVNVGDSLTAAEAASLYYRPPQDYVPGSDVGKLVYQVGDGQFTVTGEVRVNVLPVDDAPVARAGVAAGNEDGTLGNAGNPPVTLTLTGSDVDSPITAVTVTALPANGLLFLADGVTRVVAGVALTPAQAAGLLFVPNADFNGTTTLQFTVRSPDLTTADPNDTRDSAPATFTLNIRPVNDAPVATNVTVSALEEGQPVALGIGAPTDIDDPAGALLITVTELPDTGAVLLNANDPTSVLVIGQRLNLSSLQGLFYQPPADYDGQQPAGALVYEVTDNKLITTGSATINLRPINDTPVASEVNRTVADPSKPLAFELSGSDRDGNVVAFIITSLPPAADGELVLASNGGAITAGQRIDSAGPLAVRFVPALGFSGTATFSYQVVDDGVNSPNGTAAPLTSAPVQVTLDYSGGAAPDITVVVSGPEDSNIPFAAADVGEPGGLITLTDLPNHGSLTFPDGTPVPVGTVLTPAELEALVFTPDPDYNGSDGVGFSYQPPGGGPAQSGEINITVTPTPDVPVAVNDSVAPTAARQPVEDRPFNINVLANDFDPDAGETALLRVTAINGQAISTGGTVAVFSPGGLRWGAVTLLADGTLQFTPAADVNGPVSFDYTVTDPTGRNNAPDGGSRNGSVSLNLAAVNDAPQALLPDSVATDEDTPVTFNPVLNDTDVDGDPLRVTDVKQAAHGLVVLNADGSVTYTPDKDYFGPDSYSYTVADGQGGVTTGTVNVTVRPVNDAPVAANTKLVTNEDAPLSGRLPVATDVEGDPIAYSAAQAPAHGTLVVNADGSYVYTPAADYFGSDSFSYTVSDAGGSNTYTVGVNVKPLNDAPVVVNRTLTVSEEAATVSLGAAASDVDVRDRLTITVTGLPGTGLGTVLLDGAAVAVGRQLTAAELARLTYTAPADYDGVTPAGAFTYRVSDGLLTTNGSIVIDLQPVNDAPVNKVPLTTLAVAEDGSLAFTGANKLSLSDVDAGSGAITVTLSAANGGLTLNTIAGVTIGGNGSGLVTLDGTLTAVNSALASLVFRPAPNFNGATTISLLSNDRGNTGPGERTDLDLININVTALNDAPGGGNSTITLNEDSSHVLARADFGFADGADNPPNGFASVLVSPASAGALRLDGNLVAPGTLVTVAQIDAGRLVFTPAANANGNAYASFGFQVRDNGGTANGGVDTDPTANTVSFDVLPVNDAPSGADKTLLPGLQDSVGLTLADFGFSDPGDTPADGLLAVVFSTLPVSGRLELDGAAVLLNQAVSAADIAVGKLVFLPGSGDVFKLDDSLGFQVRDDGGAARGGVDTDATPNTLNFDFTPAALVGAAASASLSLSLSTPASTSSDTMLADVFAWSLDGHGVAAPAVHGSASQTLVLHDLLGGHEHFSLDSLLGGGSGALPSGGRSPEASVVDTRLLIEGIDIHAVLAMPGSAFEHPLMPNQIERSKLLTDTA